MTNEQLLDLVNFIQAELQKLDDAGTALAKEDLRTGFNQEKIHLELSFVLGQVEALAKIATYLKEVKNA